MLVLGIGDWRCWIILKTPQTPESAKALTATINRTVYSDGNGIIFTVV